MITVDRVGNPETQRERQAFRNVRNAQVHYSMRLRQIARHIGDLIRTFQLSDDESQLDYQIEVLSGVLERYADTLRPWARNVAKQMLVDVSRRDARAWAQYARFMGLELRRDLQSAPIESLLIDLLDQQVNLITSLPLEAAQRVQRIAMQHLYTGQRAETMIDDIMRTGEVTRNRATTIARTETSRAATGLTMIRAVYVGSTHYQWLTANDWKVRPLHKKLNGTIHKWNEPPISGENGERAHPGAIYNCRCVAIPIIPTDVLV